MIKDLLNPVMLAERWDVTPYTLRQWRWKGIGPLYFKIGKSVKYRIEDVTEFEKSKLRRSTTMCEGDL